MGCRRRWPGLSRSWSGLASAGPARAPEAAGGGVFAEGCGWGAGPAWLSQGRPTTWPGGARRAWAEGQWRSPSAWGQALALGSRAVGEAPDLRMEGAVCGESSQSCQGGRSKGPLRLLALFSSSLLRWCWLFWLLCGFGRAGFYLWASDSLPVFYTRQLCNQEWVYTKFPARKCTKPETEAGSLPLKAPVVVKEEPADRQDRDKMSSSPAFLGRLPS